MSGTAMTGNSRRLAPFRPLDRSARSDSPPVGPASERARSPADHAPGKDDRDRLGRRFGGTCGWCSYGEDDIRLKTNKLFGEACKDFIFSFGGTLFDSHVLPVGPAEILQSAHEQLEGFWRSRRALVRQDAYYLRNLPRIS